MFTETPRESWRRRFGIDPPLTSSPAERLLAHRSVRQFSAQPIDDATMALLIGCAQSAATSSNLQLWSVLSVQEPERRERIARLCADQNQIREASWFLAFLVDHRRLRQVSPEAQGLDYHEFFIMGCVDAALAAERLVCAAELMGIGNCYIGALRNDARGVAELLELPEGVFGIFGLCLGWPAEEAKAEIKPRLAPEAIWFRERYPAEIEVSEYDDRMRAFYEAEGMKGEVTWSMRSGRRVDGSERSLTGRGELKAWLEAQGFSRR